MKFSDTILLTGAGFTANFGGFLAREMWSKIFNNPKLNEAGNLKLELRKNFDFEEIYSMVLDNKIPNLHPNEYNAFVEALNEAYLAMDQVIKEPSWESYGIHPADLRKFLDFFRERGQNETSLCFTLNQDLFLERNFGWQPLGPQSMRYQGSFGNIELQDINSDSLKRLPNENELIVYKGSLSESFCYIKLHGSQKWIASDGRNTRILGINKREAIERIPLLKWYFALFEQALFRHNARLVIIGYGFKDNHINACISKAASEYGLKIYIISPEDPDSFKDRLVYKQDRSAIARDENTEGIRIWNSVYGYFPYRLSDIFPYPQRNYVAERSEIFQAIGFRY